MAVFFEQQARWYVGVIGVVFAVQSVRLTYIVHGYMTAQGVPFGAEDLYVFLLASLFLLLYLGLVCFRVMRRQRASNMRLLAETACSYIVYYIVAFSG